MVTSERINIPVECSARHVHLSQEDLNTLFGHDYQLTPIRELSQPGQFAAKEKVWVYADNGQMIEARIIGPAREASQVELTKGEARRLGIPFEVRTSGDVDGAPMVNIARFVGQDAVPAAAIIADRHIHIPEGHPILDEISEWAERVNVVGHGDRGDVTFSVSVKVSKVAGLAVHLDVEEFNAFGVKKVHLAP